MRRFTAGFAPIAGATFEPAAALGLRLILVLVFRDIALRDPLLPAALLPGDWPGREARRLFAQLYRTLSSGAEAAADAASSTPAGPPATAAPCAAASDARHWPHGPLSARYREAAA